MRTLKNNNTSIEFFDSVREFVRTLETAKPNKAFARRSLASGYEGNADWYGTENFADAQQLMRSGYKDGCKDLLKCKYGIKVSFQGTTKTNKLHVAGFAACVPAAIQGMPKTMYYTQKQKRNAPVINLYYDMSANCDVCTETLILGGKNIYSLIRYLESKGIKVNLYSVLGTTKSGKNSFAAIRIKADAMPINPQLISYPLIHPSFLRRHFFRWIETSKLTAHHSGRYGSASRSVNSNMIGLLTDAKLLNKESFYIDYENSARATDLNDLMLRIGIKF